MWCISLTVQSVLGMPRPVVPLSLSHPGWASCTTTGTTPTTSTPTMLVVTYKRGVTPSEFSLARASTQGWYNTQVISPPFLHHCLCIEWTVNSEQVGYPAYLQNNCYSLIVIPSGLASKKRILNIFFYLNHMSLNTLPYLHPIPTFLCGRTSLSVINRIISFYHNRVAKLRLPS